MKKFYFVGGPKPGKSEEFFRQLKRLEERLRLGASILTRARMARHYTSPR